MEAKWKDVAHLYFGCEGMAITEPRGIEKIIGVNETTLITNVDEIMKDDFKPILRPLSDMTDKEAYEVWRLGGDHNHYQGVSNYKYALLNPSSNYGMDLVEYSRAINYLLSKHFDLFGLIESSQAINKTELTAPIGD